MTHEEFRANNEVIKTNIPRLSIKMDDGKLIHRSKAIIAQIADGSMTFTHHQGNTAEGAIQNQLH